MNDTAKITLDPTTSSPQDVVSSSQDAVMQTQNPQVTQSEPFDQSKEEQTQKQEGVKINMLGIEELKKFAERENLTLLEKTPVSASSEAVRLISEDVAKKHGLIIFDKDEREKVLHVAMSDPHNLDALNILRFLAQKERLSIETYLATDQVFDELFRLYGSAEHVVDQVVSSLAADDEEGTRVHKAEHDDLGREDLQDAPVAKLVQVIIRHALEGQASDIHIEPIDNSYRVRFRLDGILHASLTFPKEVGKAVVSRIKILAHLKIDEKRKPQDGRFRIREDGMAVDFRVSTLPVIEGEKVVMRVLEKDRESFDLSKLGLMGGQYDLFTERIRDPYGLILMTGPTGSGKSTTLYAFLKILNEEDRNIITLEDPVEYFIPGINQSQVKPEIGYNFASGLRSILRQDPNVIMVGEIRDSETAELAIHAALTGHLVFSTVHTNSAVGALPRLMDMGIEPFLIASSARAVAAQRLLRRICDHCKEEQKISPRVKEHLREELASVSVEEQKKYGIDVSGDLKVYKGRGCDECGGLGLKGRLAIYAVVDVDEDLQEAINEHHDNIARIEALVAERPLPTLRQDGLLKVLLGMTTLSELERVTGGSITTGGAVDEMPNNETVKTEESPQDVPEAPRTQEPTTETIEKIPTLEEAVV